MVSKVDPKFSTQESGITLVELLVAVALLAVVAVLGWKGLDSIIFSQKILSDDIQNMRNLQIIFAQIQTDCQKLVSSSRINSRPPITYVSNSLTIHREAYLPDGTPAIQIIKYFLQDSQLYRSSSTPTRSINELHAAWKNNNPNQLKPVRLAGNIESINFSLWNNISQKWQKPKEIEETKVIDDEEFKKEVKNWNSPWNGLAFAIKIKGSKSEITKIVTLGPS